MARHSRFRLVPALALALALGLAAVGVAAADGRTALSPEQRALHVLDRLGYGPAPGDLDRVMHMGVDAYVEQQLHPETLRDPPALSTRLDALETLKLSSADLYADYGPPARRAAGGDQAAVDRVNQRQNRVADQAREARLLRAIYSPAQLQEAMVDFWFNHFNVFIDKGQEDKIWTAAYERDAIRPYALGRFRQLLFATATHPAMLYYLDNWQSSAVSVDKNGHSHGGLNENYAREVMELHTLGVDGGYSQADVTELARILTGWTFVPKELENRGLAFHFDPKRHDYAAKRFLGRSFPEGGGVDEGERALDMLAASPATARHIAFELAQYFVADRPPPKLVDRLAQRFMKNGGDIRDTLALLFKSPEFWDPRNVAAKYKTPYQYVVSSVRASGLPMALNVRPLLGALYQNGQPLYACLTPDGYKNTQAAWLNPDAMIYRLNFANALGSGNLPLWQVPPAPAAQPAMAGGLMDARAVAAPMPTPAKPQPPDPFVMQATLGAGFSLDTAEALAAARPPLRPGLMLGSPEFMRH
ncbi:MAG: DUF1800 domain-containing protein [Nevskia sp.]|nr:DUF1800 domain-containing protein [Nevskia sp.]